jgi:proline iminopeptidase
VRTLALAAACVVISTLGQPSVASATEWLTNFTSGRETCAQHSDVTSHELGHFVDVPIDDAHPEQGLTSIYYWTKEPFDRAKPSVIYFAGGPGASSHQSEFVSFSGALNVIYFDQRGVSCSKASTFAWHRNPKFYSSENTAKDADRIRQDLGLDQIAVYGHSYGTVPATIYASFYPEHTQSLILEGTVYEGGKRLYQSDYIRGQMQKHYDGLSPELKELIQRYSQDPRLSPSWYSKLNQFMMYLDDPFSLLDRFLESTLMGTQDAADNLQGFATRSMVPQSEEEFGFGAVPFAMLGCQELGLREKDATFFSVFDSSGHLISDGDSSPQNRLCDELQAKPSKPYYSAGRYPVQVPVTYFQGEYDGAAELPGALQHFKTVPTQHAQLLVLERGGHLPNQGLLNEKQDLTALEQKLFISAAKGEQISGELLDQFNKASSLRWTLRAR